MSWPIRDDSEKDIIEEIYRQTDRGAALIAGAYLEERLVDAIKARTNRHDKIENMFYKGSGPLAAFSTKIDLGLLLGIYEPKFHRMLHTVKDIRNAFAHKTEPIDFNSQNIRDLCANINVGATVRIPSPKPSGGVQFVEFSIKPDGTPKTAFLNAVKFLVLGLDMELKTKPPRVPAPPVLPPYESDTPSPEKF